MTLEEIIGCDAARLEAFTDEELDKHFSYLYNITRPERASQAVVKQEKELAKVNPKLLQGMKLAAQLGFGDLAQDILRNKKKK
jgi:hypothetical protein